MFHEYGEDMNSYKSDTMFDVSALVEGAAVCNWAESSAVVAAPGRRLHWYLIVPVEDWHVRAACTDLLHKQLLSSCSNIDNIALNNGFALAWMKPRELLLGGRADTGAIESSPAS